MADQDYPNLYALMEQSIAWVRDAALAYEKSLGGSETDTVQVRGYPDQPTLAGRVAAALAELAETMESAAMAELRSLLREIPVDPGSMAAFEFSDGNRFLIGQLFKDGTLDLPGYQIKKAPDGLEISGANGFISTILGVNGSNINGLLIKFQRNDGIEVQDQNGFILAMATKDGVQWGRKTSTITSLPTAPARLNQQKRTLIKQIIGYGQSLSVGLTSIPPISTTQLYQNVMLASGVRLRPGDVGYNKTAFVPLIEEVGTFSPTQGETPVSGMCNGITRRAIDEGEDVARWVMAGMVPGRSGWSVEQLSPPPLGTQQAYEKMVEMVKDCHDLAVSQGSSYSVWGYYWMQGESNYQDAWERSGYQYGEYELALFDQLTLDVQAITKQLFQPYIFSYQVAAHRKYSRDAMPIALMQWRLSRLRPDLVISAPCYMFPVSADNLHLTNEGSWLMGEYMSRAAFETMVRRNGKWRPLEPISVDWTDTYIDVKFHVPCGKLVLDSALCVTTHNMGFDIRVNDVVNTTIISGVAVQGTDTVRISLNAAADSTAVLTYARGRPGDPSASGPTTGARGNLRDTHGLYDTAVSPLGNVFALHNACVMFQYSRKTGF